MVICKQGKQYYACTIDWLIRICGGFLNPKYNCGLTSDWDYPWFNIDISFTQKA